MPKNNLHAKFMQYHRDNPKVYELFKKYTFKAIRAGYSRLSADLIMHRVRWETNIVTKDDINFKISNNHIAYYSRLFMGEYPLYKGFFRIKLLRSECEGYNNLAEPKHA